MSNAQDQPPRDPGGAATATGGAGGAGGTQPADAARQYVPRQGSDAPRHAAGYDDTRYADTGPSGMVLGLTMTAAVLMMLSGVFSFLEGLAAIIRGQFFVVLPNYAFSVSATGWGWLHLILGILVFGAGAALLTDKLWARITGVVLVSFSAIANFITLPYYPVWSILVIALDAFIIWALLSPRRA